MGEGPLRLRIEDERLFRGCTAGLHQRTAVVTVCIEGLDGVASADGLFPGLRAGLVALFPEDPLFGISPADWPSVVLMGPTQGELSVPGRVGEWIVAVTVALQRWARDPAHRGRVLGSESGRVRLALPWQRQGVLTDCLRLALRLIELWSDPSPAPARDITAVIRPGMEEARKFGLPPSALRYALAAAERGIPVELQSGHVQYGWGRSALRMADNFSGRTGFVAALLAGNKLRTMQVLCGSAVPIPRGDLASSFDEALTLADSLGWPVVAKPVDQEQARGVTLQIQDEAALRHAYEAAAHYSPGQVVIEKHVDGDDHRLLVVEGTLLAAARRLPAGITGDGVSSVEELVECLNADPRRGTGFHSLMKKVVLDAEALELLVEAGVTAESVPAAGRWIPLRRTPNISTGGTAVDVTAVVHPDNRNLAERVARIVGLDIAGIDFLSPDISRSWREVGGVVCEVNAQPGFRPHWISDPERDLNGEILDVLLAGRSGRIPTAAITGTNGKTTTALMLHHIWMSTGAVAAVCTTQQVKIGGDIVSVDNLSGYPGGRIMLNDPATEVAVIEVPRKGLLEFGHPCDRYDVAALLNISDDHLGVDGIDTIEQMAELKAEVLERAHGAVVVNADDPQCLSVLARAGTRRHILVAEDPTAGPIARHIADGGEAVVLSERCGQRCIMLAVGAESTMIMPVDEVPATMDGLLRVNVSNAMFAAALAWAQGLDLPVIRTALGSFTNSADQNPGRYNVLDGLPFRVLLDYAHNPAGVDELCRVVSELPVTGRRIVCNLHAGTRHPSHLTSVMAVLAKTFDVFVLGAYPEEVNPAYAAETADPLAAMLARSAALLNDAGVNPGMVTAVPDPMVAMRTALSLGRPGDLVVLMAAPEEALPVVAALRDDGGPVPSTR